MTLTNEQLNELTPEQVDEYNQGIDDCVNNLPFNPDWSEARKEGYRDALEQQKEIMTRLFPLLTTRMLLANNTFIRLGK